MWLDGVMRLMLRLCIAAVLGWSLPGAQADGVRGEVAPAHLTQAEIWASPSEDWEPPPSLSQSSDAVLSSATTWARVDLPHARERSTVSTQAQASAQPEVWWYRLRVPGEALAATPRGARLYIPRWQTLGTVAVYAESRLVWQSRGSRVWNSFNRPVWVDLAGHAVPGTPLEVYVRMANLQGVGGALSTVWAGPSETLWPSWRLRRLLQTDLVAYLRGAYLVLGAFALVMWLARRGRGETGYLLFFLLSVANLMATFFYLVDAEGVDLPDGWFSWLTLVGSLGSSVCSVLLLCQMQGQRYPRLSRALLAYSTLVALAALPLWSLRHETMLPLLRLALFPPGVVVLCVAVLGARRERSWPSVLLAGAVALSFPLAFHDLAMQRYRISIEHIYLTPYVYMGVFTMFLLVAFTRYYRALGVAEQANAVLGERLAAQEQQLLETHGLLRAAERDQTLLHERQRLMREMHDGVGSSLMSALRLVEGASPVDVAQVLRECIDDLKISIDSLEPVDADLLALLAGLRYRLGPRLEGAGLVMHWQVSDVPSLPWLDAQSALHVLRILQEVLTNILKHSGATEIALGTAEAPEPGKGRDGAGGVQVFVWDNGRPFTPSPPESLLPARRGLANVRSRALALGAHCAWSAGETGSVFTLWLPLRKLS
jgi:signal transduction histidine kinase